MGEFYTGIIPKEGIEDLLFFDNFTILKISRKENPEDKKQVYYIYTVRCHESRIEELSHKASLLLQKNLCILFKTDDAYVIIFKDKIFTCKKDNVDEALEYAKNNGVTNFPINLSEELRN